MKKFIQYLQEYKESREGIDSDQFLVDVINAHKTMRANNPSNKSIQQLPDRLTPEIRSAIWQLHNLHNKPYMQYPSEMRNAKSLLKKLAPHLIPHIQGKIDVTFTDDLSDKETNQMNLPGFDNETFY